ncbi:MAG: BamA/TamA family outer membrane protein [Legionella sp.]|nr:BamA/TamA family outer membrane protein [Legionella sp.]
MNKKICLLILTLCMPFLMGAEMSATIQVKGIKGKLLSNVQSRLDELAENKSLITQSEEALKLQIEKAMYPYGFFKPDIDIIHQGSRWTFIINPGPRLLINKFSLTLTGAGATNHFINKALREIPLKQGDPLNSVKYEQTKQLLMNAAEHQGYLHASFDKAEVLIDKANYTSSITLIFNTGPQYFFGQVRFDPTYISPDVLRRYIPFEYGQPYSGDQLQEFNNYLIGSGYFRAVSVKPQTDTGDIIPIDVHLEPRARTNYSLGVGFGTDTGIRGRAGMHIVPLNPAGHKFNAVALGSFNENALQAQYIIPGKNPLTDQYEITGSLSTLSYDVGYSRALLLSMSQRHNTTNFQRVLSLNNLHDRYNYSLQPKFEKFSFFPKASFTWLNKSNQLFSPNGYNVTVNGFVANKSVLSELSFSQASIDAKAAFTLEAIRTRLYFHTINGITEINNINEFPLSLALLLGGAENLKGYDYNSIGPGKILTYGGFEIQKETKKNWFLTGFFDTGAIYDPRLKSLKNDVGIGLMWVSPIGPIKIGVAEPVDAQFNRMPHRNPHLVISMGPDL